MGSGFVEMGCGISPTGSRESSDLDFVGIELLGLWPRVRPAPGGHKALPYDWQRPVSGER